MKINNTLDNGIVILLKNCFPLKLSEAKPDINRPENKTAIYRKKISLLTLGRLTLFRNAIMTSIKGE